MAKSRELLASDRYMGFILSQNEKKKKKRKKSMEHGEIDILYQNGPGQRTRCTFHN